MKRSRIYEMHFLRRDIEQERPTWVCDSDADLKKASDEYTNVCLGIEVLEGCRVRLMELRKKWP